jgi:hypothetical protein
MGLAREGLDVEHANISCHCTQVVRDLGNFFLQVGKQTTSVVWWSEFLAAHTEIPGSIPGATRFSE